MYYIKIDKASSLLYWVLNELICKTAKRGRKESIHGDIFQHFTICCLIETSDLTLKYYELHCNAGRKGWLKNIRSKLMDNRRDFLRMAGTVLPAGAATTFLATGCSSACNDVEEVAEIVGSMPGNIIYTATNQGIWEGKAGSHAPMLNPDGSIVTKHGMLPAHYIVRHTLVSKEGEVVFAKTFAYNDKEAKSMVDLSKIKKGEKYFAFSYCNKHDLWMSEVSI